MLKLIKEIIANSCVKACFQLGSGEEVLGMSRHMGLNPEQMEAIYHLDRQEVVCRVGLGYTEPMMVQIHDFQDKPISTAEICEIMKPKWDKLLSGISPALVPQERKVIPEKKAKEIIPLVERTDEVKPVPTNTQASSNVVHADTLRVSADILDTDDQAYLRVTATHPWRLVSEIYSLLSNADVMGNEHTISQSRAVKIRQKLIKMGYLESIVITGTGKSGRSQCDIPTEKAQLGKVYKPRGNFTHGFWCYRVSEFFRLKGAKIKIGDTLSGNEVDIDVTVDNRRLGVEVVITGLVIENMSKFISKGYFDEMVVLCIDFKKRDEVIRDIGSLDSEIRQKVSVELLKEYFVSI